MPWHPIRYTRDELALMDAAIVVIAERVASLENPKRIDLRKTQDEANRIGLFSEYGIAKYFGLPLDVCGMLKVGLMLDNGIDLHVPGVGTFQIKGTARAEYPDHTRWFWFDEFRPDVLVADFGALVYVFPDRSVGIAGVISQERFRREAREVRLPFGPAFGVPSTDLADITQVFARRLF